MQVTAEQIRSVKRLHREDSRCRHCQGGQAVQANDLPTTALRLVDCFSEAYEKTMETMRVGRAG